MNALNKLRAGRDKYRNVKNKADQIRTRASVGQRAATRAQIMAKKAAETGAKAVGTAVAGPVGGIVASKGVQVLMDKKKRQKMLLYIIGGILTFILFLILILDGLNFTSKEVSVTLTKTGPEKVANGEDINYNLKVNYTGSPREIVVTDKLPADTDFVSASGPGNPTYDPTTRTVTWRISVSNGTGTGSASGDIVALLPPTIPTDPPGTSSIKDQILNHFRENPDLVSQYKDASGTTNIPWQVFAGMHWREGDALPNYSLTSGRPIGDFEPDRNAAGDCSGPIGVVDGKADTNCEFASAVDDIMFAADHLIGKIGKVPSTYEEIVQAFSRYNGTGNENCGRSPYPHCPPDFESEDSAYTLNFFDDKHGTMYAIYCSDGTQCAYGTRDQRPGALTVTKWVAESIN